MKNEDGNVLWSGFSLSVGIFNWRAGLVVGQGIPRPWMLVGGSYLAGQGKQQDLTPPWLLGDGSSHHLSGMREGCARRLFLAGSGVWLFFAVAGGSAHSQTHFCFYCFLCWKNFIEKRGRFYFQGGECCIVPRIWYSPWQSNQNLIYNKRGSHHTGLWPGSLSFHATDDPCRSQDIYFC